MSLSLGKDYVQLSNIMSNKSISFCEVEKCPAVRRLRQCLLDIKNIAENYPLINHELGFEQILTKIKEVE